MKKRLLSAALALAMVLTMLPLTVFAETTTTDQSGIADGKTVYYKAADTVINSADGKKNSTAGWYYESDEKTTDEKSKIWKEVTSGIIEGTSTSGKWHATPIKETTSTSGDTTKSLYSTSFTLLGNLSSFELPASATTMTVDVNGHSFAFAESSDGSKLTSLKIQDSRHSSHKDGAADKAGTYSLPNNYTVSGRNFELTVTNATTESGAITVQKDDSNDKDTAHTLKVTLNNAEVGDLESDGKLTVNATNGSKTGTLKSATTADIDIVKSANGEITIAESASEQADYKTGTTIDLSSANNGDGDSPSAITVNGGATINIKDMSKVDDVTVIGGISYKSGTTDKVSGGKVTVNVSGQSTTGTIATGQDNAQVVEVSVTGGSAENNVDAIDLSVGDVSHIVKVDGGYVGAAPASGGSSGGGGGSTPGGGGGSRAGSGAAALTMAGGTLTVSNSAHIGKIVLGTNDGKATITANISGANTVIESLERVTTADSTVNISGGTFIDTTKCVDLGTDYKKQTITGGTFGSSLNTSGWLKDVTYEIKGTDDKYTYTKSFQDVVDAEKNKGQGTITVSAVGADTSKADATKTVKFYLDGKDEANLVATIKTDASVPLILPTSVNGTNVSTWFVGPNNSAFNAGEALPLRDADKESGGSDPIWKVYTDSTLAANGEVSEVSAADGITAKLENGTIKLTGTVDLSGTGVSQNIALTVKTDAGNTYDVVVTYFQTQKDVIVSDLDGMESYGNKGIRVPGSTTVWTVDGKSLVVKQANTDIGAKNNVKADVHLSVSGKGDAEKKLLEDALKQTVADFSKSPAIEQALNKVLGSINLTTAQRTGRLAVAAAKKDTDKTDKHLADAYGTWKDVEVRPVLYITASNWVTTGSNHSIDLDIKPYYQLMLKKPNGWSDTAVTEDVAAGNVTALSLDSSADAGAVKITLTLPTGFTTSTNEIWAHHGDYVYQVQSDKSFINIHGFSLFRINGVKPLASIADGKVQNPVNDPASTSSPVAKIQNYYYDDLQVAVDEVADTGVITVNAGYPANETRNLSVTGKARAFKVKCTDGTLALTFNVDAVKTGDTYDVKLEKDNLTTAKIVVGTATNGAAAVSVVNANRGSTVTGTLSPSKGYKVGTVTAKSNTGANVSVSVDTTKNTFSFVVPSDATSVTVTPTFVVDDGMNFVDVNENDWFYDGVYYCFTHNAGGQPIMEGTDATHFYPGSTLVRGDFVKVLWRLAGAPVETPTVTYSDVPSSYHAYNAIVWATNHGIAKGYGDGTFKPTVGVSRQEMVTFLWRAAESPKVSLDLASRFTDGGGVASWAREAMQWAAGLNILCGVSSVNVGSTLYPWAQAQRAQIAVTAATYHDMYIS